MKRAVHSGEGGNWKARWFVLRGASLLYYKDEDATTPKGEFVLTPDSTVYETNLRPFAFELVTSGKVLHMFGADDAEKSKWMDALRRNIAAAPTPVMMDPVQAAARKRAVQDEFYDVTFATKKPLGVTLEQHSEWAVVKMVSDRTR